MSKKRYTNSFFITLFIYSLLATIVFVNIGSLKSSLNKNKEPKVVKITLLNAPKSAKSQELRAKSVEEKDKKQNKTQIIKNIKHNKNSNKQTIIGTETLASAINNAKRKKSLIEKKEIKNLAKEAKKEPIKKVVKKDTKVKIKKVAKKAKANPHRHPKFLSKTHTKKTQKIQKRIQYNSKYKKRSKKYFAKAKNSKTLKKSYSKKSTYTAKKTVNYALKQNYLNQVRARINANKYYPRRAKRRAIQGSVIVTFTISKNGDLISINSIRGDEIFFDATKEAIYNSFPIRPPKGALNANESLTIPLHYRLY